MFEELGTTQSHSSANANRKSYFLVTTVVLGISLSAALVFSLFAVDLNLDMNDLDMVELVAPVDTTTPAKLPEIETAPKMEAKPKPGPAAAPRLATRTVNMARIDETPREAPTAVSTTQNTVKERPATGFVAIGKFDSDGGATGVAGRGPGGDGDGTGEGGLGDGTAVAKVEKEIEDAPPPPPVKKEAPKKPVIVSLGVVNGRATSLPKPSIPAAAKVAKVGGTVAVRVLIDENGNVVSASAVSGNEMLRQASESAARSAKFTPTLLSGAPAKASGVINYNFS
jgi:protein TonB